MYFFCVKSFVELKRYLLGLTCSSRMNMRVNFIIFIFEPLLCDCITPPFTYTPSPYPLSG